mmetsp:Transcript_21764/g.52624  ORF Transcript_21764/g.52624 Transcript_21764/m.52624 type:complete len:221 (-) Transcript_21764:638-1300(-)
MTFLAPPTISAALRSVNFAMADIMLTHCAASSRVGARISARVAAREPRFFPALVSIAARPPPRWSIRSMTGSKNAAVFPLPVTADAQTSLPARATGSTDAWMGVGVTNPMDATPRSNGLEMPSCEKESIVSPLCDVTREESKKAAAFAASARSSSSSSRTSSLSDSSLPLPESSPDDDEPSLLSESGSFFSSSVGCAAAFVFFSFRPGLSRTLSTSDSIE